MTIYKKDLDPEIFKKIPKYFQKWNKIGKEYKKIDKSKARKLLKQYVSLIGIKPKYVIKLSSPMACQLAINILNKTDYLEKRFKGLIKRSELDLELDLELYSKLNSELRSELHSELRSELDSKLDLELDSKLDSELNSEFRSELNSELYSELRSELDSKLDLELDSKLDLELNSEFRSELNSELYSELYSELRSELNSELDLELDSKLDSELRKLKQHNDFTHYVSYWNQSGNINAGYCAFYDFIIDNIKKPSKPNVLKLWKLFKEITKELHYFYVFRNIIFISEKPKILNFENIKLHNENKPAVQYKDGFSLYYWRGVKVPKELILTPEKITKDDILRQNNAEIRRCFREKLGAEKYYNLITDGKGLDILDSVIDNQGNKMTLYQTKEPDSISKEKVQFLNCLDPSTGREYDIYSPSQNCLTAWEAKKNTFNNENIVYRQGDVGLKRIGYNPEYPELET